ncbi:PAS domain-containing sensor histidine kinase, partial [Pseudomonas chlororaphis]|nr:PAS domain-containing sensor histidine kinase [Pseudomonas chlororaphis]
MPTSTHLNRWLRLQREGRLPDSPWLGHDPQPSLLLDAEARPVDLNPALLQWLDSEAPSEVAALLPVNHPALVRACLEQQRAIEEVEAQWGERVLLWSFIPDPHRQRVLARCREATAQILAERESATARRLYRLITENTTDLISRHTPDGTFL